jgi:hypothetical protein
MDYLYITVSTPIFIDLDIYKFVTFFNLTQKILKLAMYYEKAYYYYPDDGSEDPKHLAKL